MSKQRRVIYKYELFLWEYHDGLATAVLNLPKTYNLLTVQEQKSKFILWAIIDPSHDLDTEVKIARCYTGSAMEFEQFSILLHLSTVQASDGLVYHFFELMD